MNRETGPSAGRLMTTGFSRLSPISWFVTNVDYSKVKNPAFNLLYYSKLPGIASSVQSLASSIPSETEQLLKSMIPLKTFFTIPTLGCAVYIITRETTLIVKKRYHGDGDDHPVLIKKLAKNGLLIRGSIFSDTFTLDFADSVVSSTPSTSLTPSTLPYTVLYEVNPLSYYYTNTRLRLEYKRMVVKTMYPIKKRKEWSQCVQKKHQWNTILMGKMLGIGNYGNVFLGENAKSDKFAVKLAKLKKEATVPYSTDCNSWFEVHFMRNIIAPLIEKGKCPNLPLLYETFTCKECTLINKDDEEIQTPCIATAVEIASGDLKHYIRGIKPKTEELYSTLFQIAAGLHAVQLYGQLLNYDVKKENVLYYRVESGGYWHYVIHNIDFYVPNYGYLFILNDFGVSRSMDPNFELYKNTTDRTFRLGSRYAYVKDGKFVPINSMIAYDEDEDGITDHEASLIEWKDKVDASSFTSRGANFRKMRDNNVLLNHEIQIKPRDVSFLKKNGIEINTTSFFSHPEIIPPFEFYNDMQDLLRMFTGGKRTTQKGDHSKEKIDSTLLEQIKQYQNLSESLKEGKFSTDPCQVLAGYFIENFFSKFSDYRIPPTNGAILDTYVISK